MKRNSLQDSDRIGTHVCTWKHHDEFFHSLKIAQFDYAAWSTMKTVLRRLADPATARTVDWEYPCASTRGSVGEARSKQSGEVRYLSPDGATVIDEVTIQYRVYFGEPKFCPTELWGVNAGSKCWHEHYTSTGQQDDIDLAVLRVADTLPNGMDLHEMKL